MVDIVLDNERDIQYSSSIPMHHPKGSRSHMRRIFSHFFTAHVEQARTVQRLEEELAVSKKDNEFLLDQLRHFRVSSGKMRDELLAKFVLVLNEKKRKLQMLSSLQDVAEYAPSNSNSNPNIKATKRIKVESSSSLRK